MAQRLILHVDVNSAFLSWLALERLRAGDPLDLRTVPAAVGGDEERRRGVVLAKSYPAKARGVQTGETLYAARKKCPELLVVPSHYPVYTAASARLYALLQAYSPVIQRYSIDECFLDYTGMESVHGDALTCAETIRRRCETELGFTVNVGVSSNKVLAKMAGELRGPNCVNTLFPAEIREKLWPLPVRALFMVGRATEQALARLGAHTIGDLAQMDPEAVRYHLKSHGLTVWGYANGIDPAPVVPQEESAPKSYSNAATLARDAVTASENHAALLPLCESAAARMRREGYACRLVGVQIKYYDFTTAQHQRVLPELCEETRALYQEACALFDQLWNKRPVRLLSVKLAELQRPEAIQLTLEGAPRQQALAALDQVADRIREKYGRRSLMPAAMLAQDFSHLDRYAGDGKLHPPE